MQSLFGDYMLLNKKQFWLVCICFDKPQVNLIKNKIHDFLSYIAIDFFFIKKYFLVIKKLKSLAQT